MASGIGVLEATGVLVSVDSRLSGERFIDRRKGVELSTPGKVGTICGKRSGRAPGESKAYHPYARQRGCFDETDGVVHSSKTKGSVKIYYLAYVRIRRCVRKEIWRGPSALGRSHFLTTGLVEVDKNQRALVELSRVAKLG
jgi:hypothetical protein